MAAGPQPAQDKFAQAKLTSPSGLRNLGAHLKKVADEKAVEIWLENHKRVLSRNLHGQFEWKEITPAQKEYLRRFRITLDKEYDRVYNAARKVDNEETARHTYSR